MAWKSGGKLRAYPAELERSGPSPWFALSSRTHAVHLLLSRFCLGQGQLRQLVRAYATRARGAPRKSPQRRVIGAHPAWHAQVDARLALFRSICVPSVAAQSDQRFVWVIYVDETLDLTALHTLEELVRPLKNAVVRVVEKRRAQREYEAPASTQLKRAGRWEEPTGEMLTRRLMYLSTRLDADDAIPVKTMEKMHAKAVVRLAEPTRRSKCVRRRHDRAPACYPHARVAAQVLLLLPSRDRVVPERQVGARHHRHGGHRVHRVPLAGALRDDEKPHRAVDTRQ